MSATAILYRLLTDDPTVTAPVYPIVIPQDAKLPCLVVTLVHEDQQIVIERAQNGFRSRVSVACHGADPDATNDLGEAVKRSLETVIHRQIMTDASPPQVQTVATVMKAGSDMFDYDDSRTVFRRTIDFHLNWWRLPE